MISLKTIAATLALTAATCAANATTIDFDTLPGGGTVPDETPIGSQYSPIGVVFSAIATGGGAVLPVATNYAAGPAGPFYSGNFLGNAPSGAPFIFNPNFQLTPRYDLISIQFTNAASAVSLSLNNFSNISQTTFNAYNGVGTLIESFTFKANQGWTPVALTSSGITRLDLLTSQFQGSNTYFGIDNLNFTANAGAVPEPASWALMIAGFAMVGFAARRRSPARVAA